MMSRGYPKAAKMLSTFANSVFKYLSEQIFIAFYARQLIRFSFYLIGLYELYGAISLRFCQFAYTHMLVKTKFYSAACLY